MKPPVVILFIIGFIFSLPANAQHRIGHINSEQVIQAMPEFAQVKIELDSMKFSYQQVMTNMNNQYTQLEKELEYHAETNSDDSIESAKLKKLQDLQDAIKDLESRANDDLDKAQDEKMEVLKDKYLQAVGAVARARGYAYILDKASDSIVYAADSKDDITEAVYKKLGIIPPSMSIDTTGNGAPDGTGK